MVVKGWLGRVVDTWGSARGGKGTYYRETLRNAF